MRLEVIDLHVRYGRVHAVRGVSLTVEPGEIVAVLGANGAGKSSLLKALLGLEPASDGRILLDGVEITAWPPSRRVRHALALVPEGRRIITSLTVHENLLMGAFPRTDMRAVEGGDRRHLRALPEPRGAPAPAGVGALGRRAADAGDRARAPRQPEDHDAGRALARLEPAAHQRSVRAHRRAQPEPRPCDPAGRAEHAEGAQAGRAAPMCWSSAAR